MMESRAAGRDHGAIDAAALERIAETLTLGLVGEGSNLEAVEGAKISDINLVDLGPSRSELLALARGLLPEGFCFRLRAAIGELETIDAPARRGSRRRCGRIIR